MPIGGGSNIVLVDDLDALVVKLSLRGKTIEGDIVTLGAGESWHEAVVWSLRQNRYGLENLALIPGTVGAAPIQNIGAYGVELAEFVESVSVIDIVSREASVIPAGECGFAYRQSRFQTEPNLLITGLCMRLGEVPDPKLHYPGLHDRILVEQLLPNPENIFQVVCTIRREKMPDPADLPNVGSFFKNPMIEASRANTLQKYNSDLPVYPMPFLDGMVKLSAAWLIDQAGLKSSKIGAFEISAQHALVIVHHGDGRPQDLVSLIRHVQSQIYSRFGVELQIEPSFLPAL